jgi:membrane-associated phospholipid phosphatase
MEAEKILVPIEYFIDHWGDNGHFIMPACASLCILYMKKYWWGFWLFFGLNTIINIVLKKMICQERPLRTTEDKTSYDYYGMPSGHSQTVMYSFAYIVFLANQNALVYIAFFFLSLVVMYQRHKSQKHSISQIIVGGALGLCLGYISYRLVKQHIETSQLEHEPDPKIGNHSLYSLDTKLENKHSSLI